MGIVLLGKANADGGIHEDQYNSIQMTTRATQYSVTDLATLVAPLISSGTPSGLIGIKNNGQVAAYAVMASGYAHAFLYSGGMMTDLGSLPGGGAYSNAYGISDNGQVAGYDATLEHNYKHGFLYSGGTLTDLGTLPGGNSSHAYGVNDSGQVVGYSETATLTYAFLYSNGTMTDLSALAGGYSYATAINKNGQVALYSPGTNVFLFKPIALPPSPPVLGIAVSSGNLIISWPTNATAFALYQNLTPTTAGWIPVRRKCANAELRGEALLSANTSCNPRPKAQSRN